MRSAAVCLGLAAVCLGVATVLNCGTEINTRVREADGSVVCSGCGAVYRPKIAQLTETESKIHGSVQKEKKNDRHTERSTSHASSLIRNVLVALSLITSK